MVRDSEGVVLSRHCWQKVCRQGSTCKLHGSRCLFSLSFNKLKHIMGAPTVARFEIGIFEFESVIDFILVLFIIKGDI